MALATVPVFSRQIMVPIAQRQDLTGKKQSESIRKHPFKVFAILPCSNALEVSLEMGSPASRPH